MTTHRRIVLGAERRSRLLAVGFPEAFLEVIEGPRDDVVSSQIIAASGEVLGEIAHEPGVADALPEGEIVPIIHRREWDLSYYLLVEREGVEAIVHWHPELTASVGGGALGLITDLLIEGWESEIDAADLVTWANRVGFTAAARLVEGLESSDRRTNEQARGFRDRFVASLESV